MDIALVTGADAGPGLAIARRLIGLGCRVYALATHFARNPFPHDDFLPISCDLADPAALTKVAEDIVAREGHVSFVVHAARRAPAPLLDTPVADLAQRLNIGLLAPLALARVTLPWLRKEQGHFVVLCWNGEGAAPGGPVTAAIEGGLHHFTEALFDELRVDGIRATTVYARANPDTAPEAAMSLDPQSAINPELVADAVEQLLRARPSNVITEIIIRPATVTEMPRLARSAELAGLATRDVQLPPRQNFPRESEAIATPAPARPADAPPPGLDDFEDEDEDEDFENEAEAASLADREGDAPRQGGEHAGPRPPQSGGQHGARGYDPDRGHGGSRRRRRRGRGGRGGRGRGGPYDDRGPAGGPPRPQGEAPPPPAQRNEYPDAEAEAEERAFVRDDGYRAPHSESDEEHDGGEGAPRHDESGGQDEPVERFRDDDSAPGGDERAEHFERDDRPRDEPPRERREDFAPAARGEGNRPPRQSSGHQGGQHHQGHGHASGGQRGGNGPRRHRGYGRRPPPGGGVGPGRE